MKLTPFSSSRSFSAKPYKAEIWMYALWPVAINLLLAVRFLVGKVGFLLEVQATKMRYRIITKIPSFRAEF